MDLWQMVPLRYRAMWRTYQSGAMLFFGIVLGSITAAAIMIFCQYWLFNGVH
jgi:hypothetical protein